jgi:hypothetical protein
VCRSLRAPLSFRGVYASVLHDASSGPDARKQKTNDWKPFVRVDVPNRRLRCAAVEFQRARDFCHSLQIDPHTLWPRDLRRSVALA